MKGIWMRSTILRLRTFAWIVLAMATAALSGQGASEGERRLDLKRAELAEGQARKKATQVRALVDQGLVPRNDLENAETDLQRALLETQRAVLGLSNELPSFRLLSATKSTGPHGEILVSLEVEELRETNAGLGARSYLVSLKSATAIISEPYQRKVTVEGKSTGRSRLDFRLLKDADELTILIASGARREEIPVLLQRDHRSHLRLSSPSYSLEGLVGDKADFSIQIERFDPATVSLALGVEGLPEGFATEWWEGEGKVRITKLRFLEGQNTQKLILRVYIPAEGKDIWLNQALPFRMKTSPESEHGPVKEREDTLELQLRPTGAPKLVLGSDNLLLQMVLGEGRTVRFWIENLGGAEARNVSLQVNYPLGVQGRLVPPTLPLLGIRERKEITLELATGLEAVPGEFTIKVVATADNRLKSLESPELAFRVVLKGIAGRGLLGLLLGVLALGGMGFLGWSHRRRRSAAPSR